jgi:Zn-dependent protease
MDAALIIEFVVLILSIIAHEVAHGYAADSLGDPTARLAGRLTLNPLPHVDLMGSIIIPGLLLFTHSSILFGWAKPVPYNPYNLKQRFGETWVALAGSATNLFLAIVFGLIVRYGAMLGWGSDALALAAAISFINLFLGIFNLIPIPPLDGFTALRSALPWQFSRGLSQLEERMRSLGIFSLILFLVLFSYVLAEPFYHFVLFLFSLIVG